MISTAMSSKSSFSEQETVAKDAMMRNAAATADTRDLKDIILPAS